MKVIFCIRSNYLTQPGGDTIQLQETLRILEQEFGCECDIVTSPKKLSKCCRPDIVHIFNIQTHELSHQFADIAKSRNIPIVLSTIYWQLFDSYVITKFFRTFRLAPKSIFKYVARVGRSFWPFLVHRGGYLSRDHIRQVRSLIDKSDWLLPNSEEELHWVAKDFGYSVEHLQRKFSVVVNAAPVRVSHACAELEAIRKSFGLPGEFLLIAARIEPTKNQLLVLEALKKHPEIPIVLVGDIAPASAHDEYADRVRDLAYARQNIFVLGKQSFETVQKLMQIAKVHALCSFRESPGLATLEALVHNKPVVVSKNRYCPTGTYLFDRFAFQCDPYSRHSIRVAITQAWAAKHQKTYPAQNFSYDHAAKATFDTYKRLCIK